MPTKLRIATFNLENLDDKPGQKPPLAEQIPMILPQLLRLNADIICLQEVNGQEEMDHPRRLLALKKLLAGTPYADYHIVSTMTEDGKQVYDERNLVILSRYKVIEHHQYKHDYAPAPYYRKVTEKLKEGEKHEAREITWERPMLHARIRLDDRVLNVINLHLKSRLPSHIKGQKINRFAWKTASGWAEGYFISSMKRVGQALEVRILIDRLFDEDEDALVVVCGDFNADLDEVPVDAIRGDVENTGNADLAKRVMVPCELTIPESSRYSFLHHGKGRMLDHLLASRNMLAYYKGSEIHNELLHDESTASSSDRKFPESDHAPVIAEFDMF